MASESTQMEEHSTESRGNERSDPNKVAAAVSLETLDQNPFGVVVPPGTSEAAKKNLVIIPVPKDFKGCKCPTVRCLNGHCLCWRGYHPCTSRCKCKDCANYHGVRGEEHSTESRGNGRSDPNKVAAAVSLEMLDQNPFGVVVPPGICEAAKKNMVIIPVPKDFKGCKCPKARCLNGRCLCWRGYHPCTSRCKCEDCANYHGVRGSDSSTKPEKEGMGGVSNLPDEAVQTIPNIETEPADDTSIMAEEPQMEEQHTQSRGFDMNKLPSRKVEPEQADDTGSMVEEPAQGEEQDTESRNNRGLDQNKRRRLSD